MRGLVLLIALLGSLSVLSVGQRPNTPFVYLDDFGWRDTDYLEADF